MLTAEEKKALATEFGQLANEFFIGPLKKQVDDLQKKGITDPLVQESIAKMNTRFDEIEKKLFRPQLFQFGNAYSDGAAERKGAEYVAFSKVLKRGKAGASPEEQKMIKVGSLDMRPEEFKVLTETDDTGGGYLAPPEFVQEIIKGIILYSPVRNIARVRNTTMRSVRAPKRTGTFAAQWVGETATRSETTGLTYGLEEIPVHELYALADISNADLEDSAFDLNAELQMEFSEQFAKAEGTAFVNGVGKSSGQPEGFMFNTAIASDVTTSASALTYGGFVTVAHNLKSFYAQNATWGMNRKTIGLTRQMVDGQNRPIWLPFGQSGLSGPNPPTILDIPYQEMPDMPDVGASTYPVVIGDFRRGYMIVDRIQIEVQRDPYTQNVKGVTRFVARKRVGGQVVLVEAIRKLQCHT